MDRNALMRITFYQKEQVGLYYSHSLARGMHVGEEWLS